MEIVSTLKAFLSFTAVSENPTYPCGGRGRGLVYRKDLHILSSRMPEYTSVIEMLTKYEGRVRW